MLDFHAQSRTVAHDRDDHGMHGIQEVGSSTLLGSIIFRGFSVLSCDSVATTATTSPVSALGTASAAASLRARCHYVRRSL
jgi:hypothetical protein